MQKLACNTMTLLHKGNMQTTGEPLEMTHNSILPYNLKGFSERIIKTLLETVLL